MKIGITYNLKEQVFPDGELDKEQVEEFDSPQTIDAICSVFEKNGFETVRLGGDISIVDRIKETKPDFVFNISEGYCGRNREAHIPAVLEMLNIPYSGSDPLTLALTLDKIMAKKFALQIGVPTPRFTAVRKINDLANIDNKLQYPLITKPAWEGSSKGIYKTSVVYDFKRLNENVLFLLEKYPGEPILIEEYIRGREFTVAVIGSDSPKILGLMEVVNKINPGSDFIYSLEVKRNWENEVEYIASPNLNPLFIELLRYRAIHAFKEFGCRDIARMDFRISDNNEMYLLEINPLPGLSPGYSDLVIMAEKWGINYDQLIFSILNSAFSRCGVIPEAEKTLGVEQEL